MSKCLESSNNYLVVTCRACQGLGVDTVNYDSQADMTFLARWTTDLY